jgi:Mn-dependent DtxR family transcriptional regulator
MGQQEIYDFLKDNKIKWFTSRDISDGLDVSIGSVTNCLRKLRESRSVQYKESGHRNQFQYKFKK